MTIKNRVSKGRRTAIKSSIASKYTGKSTTRQRAKEAAKTGKKLSDIAGGGKKTGWSGKGVVKKADLATSKKTGKKATDLAKKFKGNRAGYVKAQKARTLARQAAKTRHAAAVKRGRKAGSKA